MPKKRRKLSPEMETQIENSKRKVELINAIINDIEDEEIQVEYKLAFAMVYATYIGLRDTYKLHGFCEETESLLDKYTKLLQSFESEYEI